MFALASISSAQVQRFRGTSDASAAIALGKDLILMADDENNHLRCYSTSAGGRPSATFDMSEWLDVDPGSPEVDIEGAARVGDLVYWISSHGRNKSGKFRSSRHRFFATRIKRKGPRVTLVPEGRVYTSLVRDLMTLNGATRLGLDRAAGRTPSSSDAERERLAPKREGLNIEGLCVSPDGKTLYLGFRNPRPGRHALVVPLSNPASVIERGQKPHFGQPLLWDLGNLGIRAMTYSWHHQAIFVVAGPHDGGREFALYRWSGNRLDLPRRIRSLANVATDFKPESVLAFPDRSALYLLSDDGTRLVSVTGPHECLPGEWLAPNQCQNKHLLDAGRKTFRGVWVTVE